MSEFAERAAARWARGVAEIRGWDPDAPFVGDPLAEGIEEALDLRNYAAEGRRQRRIGPLDHALLLFCAWLAFSILRSLQRADDAGTFPESGAPT